jgi:hypothetical protein
MFTKIKQKKSIIRGQKYRKLLIFINMHLSTTIHYIIANLCKPYELYIIWFKRYASLWEKEAQLFRVSPSTPLSMKKAKKIRADEFEHDTKVDHAAANSN